MHRAKHVHLVCVCLFVKQCIFVVFKVDLFFITYFFVPFAFLMSCSSVRKTEYNFGRRPMYSAMGAPAHSSFSCKRPFCLFHRKVDGL